ARGIPFYRAFSDIAIFEVEPINELEEKLNEREDRKQDVNFDVACISEPIIRNDESKYIIASYGRRKNLLDENENPINVKINLILEDNIYINQCPASIPLSACENILIIEGEETAAEGDGGGAVMKEERNIAILIGVLSVRENIGRAYKKFMFATRVDESHDFLCHHIGICMYETFFEKDYWKHPEEVVIITANTGNSTFDEADYALIDSLNKIFETEKTDNFGICKFHRNFYYLLLICLFCTWKFHHLII
ncbi:unnamed protein product, partial [Litomosoides sigmodontis]